VSGPQEARESRKIVDLDEEKIGKGRIELWRKKSLSYENLKERNSKKKIPGRFAVTKWI
jgi:hypothetical protein